GEVVVTPETITSYTRDAAGRTLTTRRDVGAMTTTESTEYDILGRVTRKTDILGRITTTAYSEDGLTTTSTTPAGATTITLRNVDGSLQCVGGTAQRELHYGYTRSGNNLATTVTLADGSILSQSITNGYGQTIVTATPNTLGGFIYTRSEYNAGGQMVKQYQDTGSGTAPTAPTLYEYDSFGNVVKQTLALTSSPTPQNSPIVELAYSVESTDEGVFSVMTQTHYNATGAELNTMHKQMISSLSATLASKSISTDVRGNVSMNWAEYTDPAKVTSFSSVPGSNITAEVVTVDGLTISQSDNAGITSGLVVQDITTVVDGAEQTTSLYRRYTATGMEIKQRDGRGNVSTTITELAGRVISVTDAAGNITFTAYDTAHDKPSVITNAQGFTSNYKYDSRGRKIAEWGSAIQPVCFGYDEMDNMVSLSTFRAGDEAITTDPTERTDRDTTTWTYHPLTGDELSKTYADNTSVTKTYDAYNRLATETDARGNVKTHSYEQLRGLHVGTTYSDGTTARSYTYNHLGHPTQVTDDSGTRTFGYNSYGERISDSLSIDGDTHLITETSDNLGRSTGFVYSKNSTAQHTVMLGYGTDGRINSAGFLHGGAEKVFGYEYLSGSNLLHRLTKPNGMTLTQSYEAHRDLLTGMAYHRGTTLVAQREYVYDTLGRPTVRNTARKGTVVNDCFTHNTRSELTAALVNGDNYQYNYDNIGNRTAAVEDSSGVASRTEYTANELNQYTAVG
ncbi:MAG: sugar-binding protein, partial [Clostridia bacterium]|nr:sugar-binding protein [Clostridia bacterium]